MDFMNNKVKKTILYIEKSAAKIEKKLIEKNSTKKTGKTEQKKQVKQNKKPKEKSPSLPFCIHHRKPLHAREATKIARVNLFL